MTDIQDTQSGEQNEEITDPFFSSLAEINEEKRRTATKSKIVAKFGLDVYNAVQNDSIIHSLSDTDLDDYLKHFDPKTRMMNEFFIEEVTDQVTGDKRRHTPDEWTEKFGEHFSTYNINQQNKYTSSLTALEVKEGKYISDKIKLDKNATQSLIDEIEGGNFLNQAYAEINYFKPVLYRIEPDSNKVEKVMNQLNNILFNPSIGKTLKSYGAEYDRTARIVREFANNFDVKKINPNVGIEVEIFNSLTEKNETLLVGGEGKTETQIRDDIYNSIMRVYSSATKKIGQATAKDPKEEEDLDLDKYEID
jgi:hypothetical protein|tara:strand:+ start:314 stop:1234 length:921 start_codon:yes stop_codon:yes gene_type:complete